MFLAGRLDIVAARCAKPGRWRKEKPWKRVSPRGAVALAARRKDAKTLVDEIGAGGKVL